MNLFFELIQVVVGQREKLSHIPSETEWAGLYLMSIKQSLAGIVFYGVERLPREQRPSQEIIFQENGVTMFAIGKVTTER